MEKNEKKAKKNEKKRGRCVSRKAVGEVEMRRSMRYYDIDGTGVSCGNARYYVLPSELAIDETTDRSIDSEGTFQSRLSDGREYYDGFSRVSYSAIEWLASSKVEIRVRIVKKKLINF